MSAGVSIKADQYGIILTISDFSTYDEIVSAVKEKFIFSKPLFSSNGTMPIRIICPYLSANEKDSLIKEINCLKELNVTFFKQNNYAPTISYKSKANDINNSNEEYKSTLFVPKNYIFKGNINSGECLNIYNSIIIIGDVCKGGKIIANGNIVIIGALLGSAISTSKCSHSYITALSMEPELIQINKTKKIWTKEDLQKNTLDKLCNASICGNKIILSGGV